MYSSICPSLLCIRESALSQPFMTFWNLKLLECMLRSTLQLAPTVFATKPDERGVKQVRCIRDLKKAPCFRKQGATLANLVLCYQKIFVPIKLCHCISSIFVQVIREHFTYFFHFLSFYLFFSFSLLQFEWITAIWNVAVQQFECWSWLKFSKWG